MLTISLGLDVGLGAVTLLVGCHCEVLQASKVFGLRKSWPAKGLS